jgi:hypothetical protein
MAGKHRLRVKPGKVCKCGAKTPTEHVEYVIAGYPAHTYSGPVK